MRYFLEIAYKGTPFHGWQYQPNAITVQECIEKALTTLLRSQTSIVGAGRTDAGVHAEQIFAHFDTEKTLEKNTFLYKMNALLPNEIVIRDVLRVHRNAHARFDAKSRSYEYRIYYSKNPFLYEYGHRLVNQKVNIEQMNRAAQLMMSYQNFQCFSRSNTDVKTYLCDIKKAQWIQTKETLTFQITANRFLRNMVRAIVGTLLDVGNSKLSVTEFQKIIESKSRNNAGASAPAKGLFLTKITYPKSIFDE